MLKARVSSAIKSVDLKQEVGPLIIGERLNTQGSKKAKELKEKLRRLKVKSSISQVSGSEEKVSKVYNQGTKLLTH